MRAVKISVRPKPKIPVIPFRCKVYKEAKNDLTLKFGFFVKVPEFSVPVSVVHYIK